MKNKFCFQFEGSAYGSPSISSNDPKPAIKK